ncbi:FAD-binding protein [Meiothermus granaticius]|uniref:Putative FAD-linked oxidoreductase n=1 Tax=Meiothermus granaticius NBRC 107808 TaxID=1227551 RepID=A0A399FCX0_9DEIN|nr:FAD-binding protein [Meiothermus granaticius]MCL6527891.1 FAD-binding protein [Thermaceae bacterium]RIH93626.1 putative FAD-linked oxidoreductase [Meiothermus granaticius NBRC 107808]GEM87263.1 2-hydroxy-acid oxidase [Meiothermus granaticius NBRC 107808]
MTLRPTTVQELQEAIPTQERWLPRGGGSKPALSTPRAGQAVLDMTGLRGVLEYDPGEFVLVAQAGTPLIEVEGLLAQHGQYLPFDPPFVEAGATLGGTVAAGLSGPLRQRYGGVRDFILGVKFVDGEGNLIKGGGKVVKNAAGFDLPKLMVGSLGRLGVLTEVAFKVFPFPKATVTLRVSLGSLEEAIQTLYALACSPFEFYTLDLEPSPARLILRVGGLGQALPLRIERILGFLGTSRAVERLEGEPERQYWREIGQLQWGAGHLVKVPITAKQISALEARLPMGERRYLSAGNLLYLRWPGEIAQLDQLLRSQGLSGLVLGGGEAAHLESPRIGVDCSQAFGHRVTQALDPLSRFAP